MQTLPLTAILAAGVGILTHQLYFKRGEHHLQAFTYAQIAVSAITIGAGLPLFTNELVPYTGTDALLVAAYFFGGLYSSLVLYRLFFHPLNKFAGPFWARLSSLWLSVQVRKGDGHRQIAALHQKYGDFVRVGSSDLSVTHAKGVSAIYGPRSACVKGAWYELTHPMVSLQTTRDKQTHKQYRRIWSEAFSDNALRGYEARMKMYRNKLMMRIHDAAASGEALDMTKWFNFYTFDTMGDLAFGSSFQMLDTSEQHWAIKILEHGLKPLSYHFPPWFFHFFIALPMLGKNWFTFVRYCADMIKKRIESPNEVPDIMSSLIKPWQEQQGNKSIPKEGMRLLEGDSQLIIVAGSDSTAATMTHVIYELVKHPVHIEKIRNELGPCISEDGRTIDYAKLQNLPHLNGVINEALRLHPPVPTILSRRTPPEGIDVGGHFIPGNMTVWCPQYAIGRSESLYPRADSFIPERWYSNPELIVDKSVYAPFSVGAYACIGKSLALQNLRNTISEIITRFEVTPGERADLESLEPETEDHFTVGLPKLRLHFQERQV